MCRTEESLRRLKNRNQTVSEEGASQSGGDTISDEKKIREQIKLDIKYFVTTVSYRSSVTDLLNIILLFFVVDRNIPKCTSGVFKSTKRSVCIEKINNYGNSFVNYLNANPMKMF